MAGSIRLLICEDHRLLADVLALVVAEDPDLELVTTPVADGASAVEVADRHEPDVVLMDIRLPGDMDGFEATRRIREASPATKVVIMSGLEEDDLLVRAVEAGASAFLDKGEAVQRALEALKAAAAGEPLIDPATLSRVLQQVATRRDRRREEERVTGRLTPREREILQLLATGLRNDAIAARLHVSVRTVETHVQNALVKLGVHSKLEAVCLAAQLGVVSVGGSST
jgi:DNA-binding NarL/FixJ family response regulator